MAGARERLLKMMAHPVLHLLLVLAVLLYCYYRTLGSYFLADDFGEIAYVSRIAGGDLHLLWSNFTGNYMQITTMAVYRPWLLLTLLGDFIFWKTNACGYYASNLIHLFGCSALVYLLVRILTESWGSGRSALAALFSALLFTAHPLHCESVSWVVGRVDVVCLMYYLLSLCCVALFLKGRRRRWLVGACVSFSIAMLTKEMAIGLPVVATAMAFLWGAGKQRPASGECAPQSVALAGGDSGKEDREQAVGVLAGPAGQRQSGSGEHLYLPIGQLGRLSGPPPGEPVLLPSRDETPLEEQAGGVRAAVTVAAPLISLTVVYFAVRFACLGTVLGGYQGSIGASQFQSIIAKWSDLDTVGRLLLPFNRSVFGDSLLYEHALLALYCLALAMVACRWLLGRGPLRWLLLLSVWALTCLLPVYQLWGLGVDLEGGRFLFFLTVPLCLLLPVWLFSPAPKEGGPPERRRYMLPLSVALLTAFCLLFARTTVRNNLPWVHGGKETRAVRRQALRLAASLGPGQKAAILGIPKERGGTHLILNGATFADLVSPPFADHPYGNRFLTFDAMLYGDGQQVNWHHIAQVLAQPRAVSFYRWDWGSKNFVSFDPGSRIRLRAPLEIAIPSLAAGAASRPAAPRLAVPYSEGGGLLDRSSGDIVKAGDGLGLRIDALDVLPADYDFLELIASGCDRKKLLGRAAMVSWTSQDGDSDRLSVPLSVENSKDGSIAVRLRLSAYWQWYALGRIRSLSMELPPLDRIRLQRVRLVPQAALAPQVVVPGGSLSSRGAYTVDGGDEVVVTVDGRRVTGADSVELRVFKDNFFRDCASGLAPRSALQAELTGRGLREPFRLSRQYLHRGCFVQVRARCLDGRREQVGELSAPVTLQVM